LKSSKQLVVMVAAAMTIMAVPTMAVAATAKREGVTASVSDLPDDYWSYVKVCDTKADGNSAYSLYRRDSGSSNRVEIGGNGKCANSGSSNDLVSRFNACNNLNNRPDPCTDYAYRD
jgi:hypothetical protein